MLKPFRRALSCALLLASMAAQASYVLSSQNVVFTFDQLDADSFTLRIEGATAATGNWASADFLGTLAFKNIGNLAGLSNVAVTNLTPGVTSAWSFSTKEMNANGCAGGGSGGICLTATPGMTLLDDMLFQFDLFGASLNLDEAAGPHLKLMFTEFKKDKYSKVGSLLSQDMVFQPASDIPAPGAPSPVHGELPEPASLALCGLAIAAAAFAARRRRAG
jgi:hypothetical protein